MAGGGEDSQDPWTYAQGLDQEAEAASFSTALGPPEACRADQGPADPAPLAQACKCSGTLPGVTRYACPGTRGAAVDLLSRSMPPSSPTERGPFCCPYLSNKATEEAVNPGKLKLQHLPGRNLRCLQLLSDRGGAGAGGRSQEAGRRGSSWRGHPVIVPRASTLTSRLARGPPPPIIRKACPAGVACSPRAQPVPGIRAQDPNGGLGG